MMFWDGIIGDEFVVNLEFQSELKWMPSSIMHFLNILLFKKKGIRVFHRDMMFM
jgi:hypothetical protein